MNKDTEEMIKNIEELDDNELYNEIIEDEDDEIDENDMSTVESDINFQDFSSPVISNLEVIELIQDHVPHYEELIKKVIGKRLSDKEFKALISDDKIKNNIELKSDTSFKLALLFIILRNSSKQNPLKVSRIPELLFKYAKKTVEKHGAESCHYLGFLSLTPGSLRMKIQNSIKTFFAEHLSLKWVEKDGKKSTQFLYNSQSWGSKAYLLSHAIRTSDLNLSEDFLCFTKLLDKFEDSSDELACNRTSIIKVPYFTHKNVDINYEKLLHRISNCCSYQLDCSFIYKNYTSRKISLTAYTCITFKGNEYLIGHNIKENKLCHYNCKKISQFKELAKTTKILETLLDGSWTDKDIIQQPFDVMYHPCELREACVKRREPYGDYITKKFKNYLSDSENEQYLFLRTFLANNYLYNYITKNITGTYCTFTMEIRGDIMIKTFGGPDIPLYEVFRRSFLSRDYNVSYEIKPSIDGRIMMATVTCIVTDFIECVLPFFDYIKIVDDPDIEIEIKNRIKDLYDNISSNKI